METEKYTGRYGDVKGFHFNLIYRFIRKFPIIGLRHQLLLLYNNVTGWINLTFYNLPKTFPSDFKFERSKWRDPFQRPVNKEFKRQMTTMRVEMTGVEEIKQELLREPNTNKFQIVSEARQQYPISDLERKKLYETILKVGFIHFFDSGDSDSIPHGGHYCLTAHGITYTFIEYTYVHHRWREGMLQIDSKLDQMIGKDR